MWTHYQQWHNREGELWKSNMTFASFVFTICHATLKSPRQRWNSRASCRWNIQFQLTNANNVAAYRRYSTLHSLLERFFNFLRARENVYVTWVPINNNIYSIKHKYRNIYLETWIDFKRETQLEKYFLDLWKRPWINSSYFNAFNNHRNDLCCQPSTGTAHEYSQRTFVKHWDKK